MNAAFNPLIPLGAPINRYLPYMTKANVDRILNSIVPKSRHKKKKPSIKIYRKRLINNGHTILFTFPIIIYHSLFLYILIGIYYQYYSPPKN